MSKNFVFVNSDGLYEEAASFETTDFINSSAGAGDAGKPIVLDAAGNIDATMINDADIDHGSIGGLSDDDHSQYHNDTRGDLRYYTQTQLGSVANANGASLIGIEDANSKFVAINVEAALEELYDSIVSNGINYTVGAGGVSIGDLVYISANDTVLPYATLTDSHRGIGLCLTTESAASSVKVLANDTVITGLLTGATAGTPYYWDGSALSSSIPAVTGTHVWQAGVAKNATDLAVEVRFVKKNA